MNSVTARALTSLKKCTFGIRRVEVERMKVVDRKPVPIYQAECSECHSKIEYKASEVRSTGYITCPVCGSSVWGSKCYPVRMVRMDEVGE